jgi:hypothetical protein
LVWLSFESTESFAFWARDTLNHPDNYLESHSIPKINFSSNSLDSLKLKRRPFQDSLFFTVGDNAGGVTGERLEPACVPWQAGSRHPHAYGVML